jgi:hypothetical protein
MFTTLSLSQVQAFPLGPEVSGTTFVVREIASAKSSALGGACSYFHGGVVRYQLSSVRDREYKCITLSGACSCFHGGSVR